MSSPPRLPREEILPAWHAAILAYRRELKATGQDRFARAATFEAFPPSAVGDAMAAHFAPEIARGASDLGALGNQAS
jgi:hypothetical protein